MQKIMKIYLTKKRGGKRGAKNGARENELWQSDWSIMEHSMHTGMGALSIP